MHSPEVIVHLFLLSIDWGTADSRHSSLAYIYFVYLCNKLCYVFYYLWFYDADNVFIIMKMYYDNNSLFWINSDTPIVLFHLFLLVLGSNKSLINIDQIIYLFYFVISPAKELVLSCIVVKFRDLYTIVLNCG